MFQIIRIVSRLEKLFLQVVPNWIPSEFFWWRFKTHFGCGYTIISGKVVRKTQGFYWDANKGIFDYFWIQFRWALLAFKENLPKHLGGNWNPINWCTFPVRSQKRIHVAITCCTSPSLNVDTLLKANVNLCLKYTWHFTRSKKSYFLPRVTRYTLGQYFSKFAPQCPGALRNPSTGL